MDADWAPGTVARGRRRLGDVPAVPQTPSRVPAALAGVLSEAEGWRGRAGAGAGR